MGGETNPTDFMYSNIVKKGNKGKNKLKKPIQSWQQMEAVLKRSIEATNKKFKTNGNNS